MSEVITTLTGFEVKPGTSSAGDYVLTKFTDKDGKKFQTFDEGIADQAKALIGTSAVIEIEVQTTNKNGRTFTNNMIQSIRDAGASAPASSSTGSSSSSGGGDRKITANGKLTALGLAIETGKTFETFPGVSELFQLADTFVAWANGDLAGSDPEDASPDAASSDAVPN